METLVLFVKMKTKKHPEKSSMPLHASGHRLLTSGHFLSFDLSNNPFSLHAVRKLFQQ
jgi:hypothetical protein